MLAVCIKETARFFSSVALPLLCLQMHRGLEKKTHTRDATEMLFCCGALLAVHDGLRFAVRVSARFLRSAVFLCIA